MLESRSTSRSDLGCFGHVLGQKQLLFPLSSVFFFSLQNQGLPLS